MKQRERLPQEGAARREEIRGTGRFGRASEVGGDASKVAKYAHRTRRFPSKTEFATDSVMRQHQVHENHVGY